MKVLMLGMITIAAALAFSVVPGAGVSSVQAIPTNTCGNDVIDVPDSGATFHFTSACLFHDECYGQGGTESDRRACDAQFLTDMRGSCDQMWPSQWLKRWSCYSVARTYYLGVSLGGWAFFDYGTTTSS